MKGQTAWNKVDWATRVSKTCPKCGEDKLKKDCWYTYPDGHWAPYCTPCNRTRMHREHKERVIQNPETARRNQRSYSLRRRHGISIEQYDEMLEKEDAKCAICRLVDVKPKNGKQHLLYGHNLTVDHNHKTGVIRGLLCWKCNIALGHFNDDLALLRMAVKYMEERDG
jgi:hypothetical protein